MRAETEFRRASDQIKNAVRRRVVCGRHVTNNDLSLINRSIEQALSELQQYVKKNCVCVVTNTKLTSKQGVSVDDDDSIELDLAEKNKDLELRNDELLTRLKSLKVSVDTMRLDVSDMSQFRDKTGMRQQKKAEFNLLLDKLETVLAACSA